MPLLARSAPARTSGQAAARAAGVARAAPPARATRGRPRPGVRTVAALTVAALAVAALTVAALAVAALTMLHGGLVVLMLGTTMLSTT